MVDVQETHFYSSKQPLKADELLVDLCLRVTRGQEDTSLLKLRYMCNRSLTFTVSSLGNTLDGTCGKRVSDGYDIYSLSKHKYGQ